MDNEKDRVLCVHCGKEVKKNSMTNYGNKFFCENCADDWTECHECGDAVQLDDSRTTNDGYHICEHCYDRYYFTCYDCGEIFHEDNGYWNGDNHYCSSCNDNHECDCGRDGVMDYHDFPSHKYKPRMTIADKERGENLFFGVELEADGGEFDIDDFTDWTNNSNLIHFENDGSLSDDGVECITMPCSLKYHQNDMDWSGICSQLKSQGYSSHDASSCGLHVHISRDALTPIQIMKMDVFVNRGADFFSQIARREDFYSSKYRKNKKVDVHKGTYDSEDGHGARYTAVNTCNEKTVEIRIFKGTLKYQTILGTIEMCHALVKFVDTIPIVRIYDTEKNIVDFIKYMAERHDDYPHILPMMRRLVQHRWNKMVGEYYGKYVTPTISGEHE